MGNNKKECLYVSPGVTNQEKLKYKDYLGNGFFTLLEKDISSSCFVFSMKSKMTVKNSSMDEP